MNIDKKIKIFSNLKQYCIVATPRSGSDYLQSLLDNHKEILTFNGYLMVYKNFYPKINFKDKSISNVKTSVKKFTTNYSHLLNTKKDKEEGKNNLGKNKKSFIALNLKKFNNIMLHYLNKKGFSKKHFTMAIYFAYNFCLGVSFKRKKILLMHPHNWDELLLFYKDFKLANYIITIRDQRAGYYSALYNLSLFNNNQFYNLSHHHIVIFTTLYFQKIIKNLNLKHLCIRLEDLPHIKTLKLLSKILKVEFSTSLTNSTFAGKKWHGDAKQLKIYKDVWTPNRTYNKWRIKLSIKDKFLLEFLLIKILKEFNYDRRKFNFIDHFKFISLLFLPMNFEKEVLKKNLFQVFLLKNKLKYFRKLLQNFYYYLRRIIIFLRYYFTDLIIERKYNTKFLRVKL